MLQTRRVHTVALFPSMAASPYWPAMTACSLLLVKLVSAASEMLWHWAALLEMSSPLVT